VLLDFGSARTASSGAELTAIVTPGYAPIEQYHSQGRQGPWSDLYAFGGVLYWMIIGKRPVEAVARVRQDMLPPAVQVADRSRYSIELLTAVDWALVSHEEQRPQSVAEFRSALSGLAAPDPKTTTYQTTVKIQDPPQATTPPTTFPTGVAFDRDTLKRIEAELAKHIGPIASVVIRTAAKKAYTIAGLAEIVSADIANDKERAAFVRRFSGDKSTPTGDPTRATATRQQSVPPSSSSIDAQTLAKAEAALAKYIGAVAKVVVKRAAAKARDPGELYLLIAEEIEDKDERKAFIRKAISASGKE
jgi:serine/threonine protein kinase